MSYSTRDKIKGQWQAAIKSVDNCEYHLFQIVELAEGQSEHITNNMPHIMLCCEALKDVLNAFREDL
jgi:hypothetical protein